MGENNKITRYNCRFSASSLGVTLDNHPTMDSQVSEICWSAYYHIRALQHIWPIITHEVAKTLACSFVTSRLDYANSVLYGISAKKYSSPSANAERPSFSVLWRLSSATLPICYVICTGYLISTVFSLNLHYWLSTLATTMHHCICRVYFITMYLVAVYVPVKLVMCAVA